jgi:uncharacterized MAPEG superfamily protein
MTIALWCVFLAGVLPYVATMIAKVGAPGYDNRDPRRWLERQEGWRKRANAAQLNGFEAFPFFAAAVLAAHVLDAPQRVVNTLAMAFIAARLLYLALYLANKAPLRSLTWLAGFACVLAIFIAAA